MTTTKILYVTHLTTPLGKMTAAATDDGVCLLDFDHPARVKKDIQLLLKKLNAQISHSENRHLKLLQIELRKYFSKKLKKFSVPTVTVGTDFQNKVWAILKEIPYGKTQSYKEQALSLKMPKAIRAVASANGKNKIAIVIPCHRVIGSNGSLVGYASGLDKKEKLLNLES